MEAMTECCRVDGADGVLTRARNRLPNPVSRLDAAEEGTRVRPTTLWSCVHVRVPWSREGGAYRETLLQTLNGCRVQYSVSLETEYTRDLRSQPSYDRSLPPFRVRCFLFFAAKPITISRPVARVPHSTHNSTHHTRDWVEEPLTYPTTPESDVSESSRGVVRGGVRGGGRVLRCAHTRRAYVLSSPSVSTKHRPLPCTHTHHHMRDGARVMCDVQVCNDFG
jgi:hypothetical protein